MEIRYRVSGMVIRGENQGKKLGFPTANIALHENIPEGIYAAEVIVDSKSFHSATFVGAAKTFERTESNVESYILDFSDDLYGQNITVNLFKKMRENKKFDSVEELITQMHSDIKEIRAFFEESK